jgi:hypothetical protein
MTHDLHAARPSFGSAPEPDRVCRRRTLVRNPLARESHPRRRADRALLWVHVFRYVALQVFSAQRDGFPISDSHAVEIVIGDVGGAVIAFVTIALLRYRARLAIPLAWLLALETVYDTITNIQAGVREHLMSTASGVTWMVVTYFVPMVVVSCMLLIWQLYARAARHSSATSARRPPLLCGHHRSGRPTVGNCAITSIWGSIVRAAIGGNRTHPAKSGRQRPGECVPRAPPTRARPDRSRPAPQSSTAAPSRR